MTTIQPWLLMADCLAVNPLTALDFLLKDFCTTTYQN